MYRELLEKIKEYQKISIFRHRNPDGDCAFSCLAMKQFILDNFSDKEVHLVGTGFYDIVDCREKTDDDFIKGSLALVLDTANLDRIDDNRTDLCTYIIKIDHHLNEKPYGDLMFVNDKASATAELLTEIFYSDSFKGFKISRYIRECLLCGILTDSMTFSTTSTTSRTLYLASMLAEDDIVISELNDRVNSKNIEKFTGYTELRRYIEYADGCGYMILENEDLNKLGLTCTQAKEAVSEFKDVEEFKIWCIFAYNEETQHYEASLRSKSGYPVEPTARKYNGGGHLNASGISNLNRETIDKILEDLKEISSENRII